MYGNRSGIVLGIALSIAGLAAVPGHAVAQYRCAVAIELKGKTILAGEIRDTERPSTEELWDILRTLSFSATKDGRDLPDPKAVDQTTLKGALRVKVNGAGEVQLEELRLVRNKFNTSAWVIAPEDFARILKMRKEAGDEQPKK